MSNPLKPPPPPPGGKPKPPPPKPPAASIPIPVVIGPPIIAHRQDDDDEDDELPPPSDDEECEGSDSEDIPPPPSPPPSPPASSPVSAPPRPPPAAPPAPAPTRPPPPSPSSISAPTNLPARLPNTSAPPLPPKPVKPAKPTPPGPTVTPPVSAQPMPKPVLPPPVLRTVPEDAASDGEEASDDKVAPLPITGKSTGDLDRTSTGKESTRMSRFIPSMSLFSSGGSNKRSSNTMSIRVDTSHRVSTKFGECEVLFHGLLSKRTREGDFEKYMFTITTETVSYYKLPSTAANGDDVENIESHEKDLRSIPLTEVIVRPLRECDYEGSEKRIRAFRFLSKHKSFLLRAKTAELKQEWYEAFEKASNGARARAGLPELQESDAAPLWIINETSCQICKVNFSFFTRKHHCRHCGRCVCDDCSREKVRIPKFDERTLFKVCSDCAKVFKAERKYGV